MIDNVVDKELADTGRDFLQHFPSARVVFQDAKSG